MGRWGRHLRCRAPRVPRHRAVLPRRPVARGDARPAPSRQPSRVGLLGRRGRIRAARTFDRVRIRRSDAVPQPAGGSLDRSCEQRGLDLLDPAHRHVRRASLPRREASIGVLACSRLDGRRDDDRAPTRDHLQPRGARSAPLPEPTRARRSMGNRGVGAARLPDLHTADDVCLCGCPRPAVTTERSGATPARGGGVPDRSLLRRVRCVARWRARGVRPSRGCSRDRVRRRNDDRDQAPWALRHEARDRACRALPLPLGRRARGLCPRSRDLRRTRRRSASALLRRGDGRTRSTSDAPLPSDACRACRLGIPSSPVRGARDTRGTDRRSARPGRPDARDRREHRPRTTAPVRRDRHPLRPAGVGRLWNPRQRPPARGAARRARRGRRPTERRVA